MKIIESTLREFETRHRGSLFNGSSSPLSFFSWHFPINGPEGNLWHKIIYYDIVKNEKLLHPLRGCARKTQSINESCSPLDFHSFFVLEKDFCTLVLSRVVFHLSTFFFVECGEVSFGKKIKFSCGFKKATKLEISLL